MQQFLHDKIQKNNVLSAMCMASKARNNVMENTIANCLKQNEFKQNREENGGNVNDIPNETPEQLNEVANSLNNKYLTFEEFISFDDHLAVWGELVTKFVS